MKHSQIAKFPKPITVLILCLISTGLALLCRMSGLSDLSVVFACGAIVAFYLKSRSVYSHIDWLGNPIRLLVPILTAMQVVYWLWFGVFLKYRPSTIFDGMIPALTPEDLAVTCTDYLLAHLVFFVALDYGYKTNLKPRLQLPQFTLRVDYSIVLSLIAIASASAYVIFWLIAEGKLPAIIGYPVSFILRIFPLSVALMAYLFATSKLKHVKLIAAVILTISCILGFIISLKTGMRFMFLEQIAIIFLVIVAFIKWNRKSILIIAAIILIAFVLFTSLTVAKHEIDIRQMDTWVDMGIFGVDRFVQRVASFTTDTMMLDSRVSRVISDNPEITTYRILDGLPFAGLIYENPLPPGDTINLRIYEMWSGDYTGISSIFVSGLSEIKVAFNIYVMLFAAVFFGLLHGSVSSLSRRIIGNYQYLVIIAIYAKLAIHGIEASTFFDGPLNIIVLAVALRIVSKPNNSIAMNQANI